MNSTIRTPNILVVDDDPLNRRFVERTLANAGFATATAENGEEAVDRLLTERFDGVISDVQMPGMSGIDFLRNVRTRIPWLPVIIMTSLVEEDVRAAASTGGAAALLQKPVGQRELIATLRMALADAVPVSTPIFAMTPESMSAQRPDGPNGFDHPSPQILQVDSVIRSG